MSNLLRAGALGLFALAAAFLPTLGLAQTITNVTTSQRPDESGLVDISYTLSGASGPMSVSVRVSPDGGATWQTVSSVTGDVGAGIDNGTRSIVWNAGTEVPDIHWPTAQIEVKASTACGNCTPGSELTITLPGGVPLVMVCIPAGTFVMGSPPDEFYRLSEEGPQTTVTISCNYYMGKYEVTQAQWTAVMGAEWPHLGFPGRPNNPMECVSWNDTQNFITALNAHISSSGQGPATMRLPTEAEWEYACRAGTTRRFYFGDGFSTDEYCATGGGREANMWYCGNPNYQTQPVGQKLPNSFGLYDMHGNVFEWCQDWYTDSLPGGNVTDPTGPSSGSRRVGRGGSWLDYAYRCRSALRGNSTPSIRHFNIGFRLASVR